MMDLPDLGSEFRVDAKTIAQFRRDGHVAIRGLAAPDEIAAYRLHVGAVVDDVVSTRTGPKSITFTRVINLWQRSAATRRLIFARRFASVAAQFLGVPSLRLLADQALFKLVGGRRTSWHRDRPYFPLATDRIVTMWLPLVDVPKSMGPLCFATGSHRAKSVDVDAYTGSRRGLTTRVAERWPLVAPPLRVGDVSFHGCGILHSAAPNRARRIREVVTVIYFADGTLIDEPQNLDQRKTLEAFLPGARPGDEAKTALNPLVYG